MRGLVAFSELVLYISLFFSSRRRHTRWNCDWSSDVCSSDLSQLFDIPLESKIPPTKIDVRHSSGGKAPQRKGQRLRHHRTVRLHLFQMTEVKLRAIDVGHILLESNGKVTVEPRQTRSPPRQINSPHRF